MSKKLTTLVTITSIPFHCLFWLLLFSSILTPGSILAQALTTHIVRYITRGSDDVGQNPNGGYFSLSDDNIYFGETNDGQDITSGFRFQNIPITNPDKIVNAHINFIVDGRYENDIHIRFFGEASDNAQTFSSNSKPSDRSVTTNYVDWVLSSETAWNFNERHDSPDLTSILKEIIGRPGWSSGNAISIIAKNVSSNSNHRRIFGFERDAKGTELLIEIPHPIADDLTVCFISRLPEMDYIWASSDPAVEGWPAVGQQVTWQAQVKNWSNMDLQGVPYVWLLDSVKVDSGIVDFTAGSILTIDYPWMWTFDRHILEFVIDPNNIIPEDEEGNNDLSIYTNAISAGFYVEQSIYDYFRAYQYELGVHSNCWENWAQRQVKRWNKMFEEAIYNETPDGVLDRIRLEKITIVPDGALPLAGGLPTNNPNVNDRTVDLQWGFPATHLDSDFYNLLGQLIRKLVDRKHIPGYYTAQWDGKNDEGLLVPSGVYIYSLKTEKFQANKKLLLAQ
jgi:hypothetical protein